MEVTLYKAKYRARSWGYFIATPGAVGQLSNVKISQKILLGGVSHPCTFFTEFCDIFSMKIHILQYADIVHTC